MTQQRWTPEQARTRIRSALGELLDPRQLYVDTGFNPTTRQRMTRQEFPDLLTMLREAAAPRQGGDDGPAGPTSFESRPPVSLAAVQVWDDIRRGARRWAVELAGRDVDATLDEVRGEATRVQRSRARILRELADAERQLLEAVDHLVKIRGSARRYGKTAAAAKVAELEERAHQLAVSATTCDELLARLAMSIDQLAGPRTALLAILGVVDDLDDTQLARIDHAVTGSTTGVGGWLRAARVAVGLDSDPVTIEQPCPHCARRHALTVATDDDGRRAWCNSCGMTWPSHLVPLLVAQVDAARVSTGETRAERLERLRADMDSAGLSKQWLADQLGTSRPYVSQVLSGGKAVSDTTLARMTAAVETATVR